MNNLHGKQILNSKSIPKFESFKLFQLGIVPECGSGVKLRFVYQSQFLA